MRRRPQAAGAAKRQATLERGAAERPGARPPEVAAGATVAAERRAAAARFEDDTVWARSVSAWTRSRLEAILGIAPRDARSVLEVGCGDGQVAGALRRALGDGTRVVGVDRARAGLRRFRAVGVPLCGDADALPFADGSFDLVVSSEVLEHLPGPVLAGAARELMRVSRRDLLITVPHEEDLRRELMVCPACGEAFNAFGHVHSFSLADVDGLFPGFARRAWRTAGPRRRYDPRLLRLRHRLGRHVHEPTAVCPRCGNHRFADRERDPLRLLVDLANLVLNPRKRAGYWLMAWYRRAA